MLLCALHISITQQIELKWENWSDLRILANNSDKQKEIEKKSSNWMEKPMSRNNWTKCLSKIQIN